MTDVRFNLAFQKTRCRGNEHVIINVLPTDEQLEWNIGRFVSRMIVENEEKLSVLWKKNLKIDGEEQLTKRIHLSHHRPEKTGGHTIHFIENSELTKSVILFAFLMSENVTVHVGLGDKSHLFNDRTLHPISRIGKKK